jgi:adenylosuccinate synthase
VPVAIITGSQFGSEGKGKVAHWWARHEGVSVAVRVGGPNSGHTVRENGTAKIFRQLPAPALIAGNLSILPPGSYIDVDVLAQEIHLVGATPKTLLIDPAAAVVTEREREEEASSILRDRIGSTGSGTGATVMRRVRRDGTLVRAADITELRPFLGDTLSRMRKILDTGARIIIEGTQGFGLSMLHGGYGDYATSRDTTAAGSLAETGLSPLDVDQVVLVARAFPIRVAGNSGPLPRETAWADVARMSGRDELYELTTVTRRVRRVGLFDPEIVIRAIKANQPTHLVLNHVDYVSDLSTETGRYTAIRFVNTVEASIGREIDFVGINPSGLVRPRELHRLGSEGASDVADEPYRTKTLALK